METVKVCITGSVTSNWSHSDCCSERCEGHGETWQACSTWHACKCFSKCFDSPLSKPEGACCWYNSRCDFQMHFLGSAVKERLCMRFFFSQEMFQKKDPQSAWNWWRELCPIAKFSSFMSCGGIFRYTLQRMLFFLKKSFLISKYNFLSPLLTSKPSYIHLFTNFKIHDLFFSHRKISLPQESLTIVQYQMVKPEHINSHDIIQT